MGYQFSFEILSDAEAFLFERIVKHLNISFGYSCKDAIELINSYHKRFTDQRFCDEYDITAQGIDFFSHIEAIGMADRVHYYEGLKNTPDEELFIKWQRKIRA